MAPLAARPLERRGRTARAALDLAALAGDIARLARRRRPAIIVASGQRAILAAAVAPGAGARRIALHHDLAPGGETAGRPRGRAALARASSRADALVATSDAIADIARAGRHGDPPRRRPRHLGRPRRGPRAAAGALLGALVAWKRPDLALEIAAPRAGPAARRRRRAARSGGHVPALRERATQPDLDGRVRFLGRADARAALAGAHLLLHCADREPFGLALVEALAAGRPVVAPAAGGPAEIVTARVRAPLRRPATRRPPPPRSRRARRPGRPRPRRASGRPLRRPRPR